MRKRFYLPIVFLIIVIALIQNDVAYAIFYVAVAVLATVAIELLKTANVKSNKLFDETDVIHVDYGSCDDGLPTAKIIKVEVLDATSFFDPETGDYFTKIDSGKNDSGLLAFNVRNQMKRIYNLNCKRAQSFLPKIAA